jgi:hypothetical protein
LPNLPTLPTLPALPDYQAYPMVRRVSSLFPQRPASRPATAPGSKEGWWETLTGSASPSAPPAYNELYPERITEEQFRVKKASAMQAAADAALDQHYEGQSRSHAESSHFQQSASPGGATANSRGITQSFTNVLVDRAALGLDRKAHYLRVSLNLLHGDGFTDLSYSLCYSLCFSHSYCN